MKQQSKTIQKKAFIGIFMLSHSDFFRPVYKISCSTAFERSDACCFVEKRFGTQLFREPWCSVWYFSGKTVAAYYFYRDCSDPYHIFLSDAHSFGKTFWLTQWNRHSVFAGAIGNFIDRGYAEICG